MFDDLAVELGNCVTTGVAIIDHTVKAIQLTLLPLSVKACHVLCCHQVLPQMPAFVSNLSCGCGRNADHERGVVHSAEDL